MREARVAMPRRISGGPEVLSKSFFRQRHTDLMFQLSHVLGELQVKNCNKSRFMHVIILIILQLMGSAACRNEGHSPPPIFGWGANNDLAPSKKCLDVYNNSNLVNNEVFKKLTTKLASMKYYGNLV